MKIIYRIAQKVDVFEMMHLFMETINSIDNIYYSAEQRRVWAKAGNNHGRWEEKVSRQHVVVAESGGRILGFGSLEGDYIDILYVRKYHQGLGIASNIYAILEEEAKKSGVVALSADVSHSARMFFERRGFVEVGINSFIMDGVELSNTRMRKLL